LHTQMHVRAGCKRETTGARTGTDTQNSAGRGSTGEQPRESVRNVVSVTWTLSGIGVLRDRHHVGEAAAAAGAAGPTVAVVVVAVWVGARAVSHTAVGVLVITTVRFRQE
jgi:hypothetical protein